MPGLIDLTGQVFGRLKVIRIDRERIEEEKKKKKENGKKGGYQTYWICECECGNIKSVNGRGLKNGTTKSCGCLSREMTIARGEDLTGQVFDQLTVLERDWEETRRIKKVCWKCKCSCGNVVTRESYNLKKHKIQSCGCKPIREKLAGTHNKDLSGKRFGKLVAMEIDWDKSYEKGRYYWLCKCDCGNQISISSAKLNDKYGTKSCGCLHVDSINKYYTEKAVINKDTFGDYLIGLYGENALELYWDYSKNTIDPYSISKSSGKEIWIICQEKDYHGSYKTTPSRFTGGYRCNYCNGTESVHKFDSLGYLYPEISILWSDKNKKTPYEYKPNSKRKIWIKCENGIHEDYETTPVNALRMLKNVRTKCSKCWSEIEKYNYSKGENSANWKGGITSLQEHLRSVIEPWRRNSYIHYKGRCILTGEKDNNVIHHLKSFRLIIEETLMELGLEIKQNVSDYNSEDMRLMEKMVLDKRYQYGYGVCVNKDIHTLFHRTYSYHDTTKEEWEDFCRDFLEGKYNNVN